MTISSTSRKTSLLVGNGVRTSDPFTFKVQDSDDVSVYRTVDGVETLVSSSEYTVSLNANQNVSPGGSIQWDTAPTSDQSYIITTEADTTQETDIQNQGGFNPVVITETFDKLTILLQQLSERVDRSPQFRITAGTFDGGIPEPEDGKFLSWLDGEFAWLTSANGVTASAFGAAFVISANAAAGRTALGLGTAAVKDTGTSGDALPLLDQSAAVSGAWRFDADFGMRGDDRLLQIWNAAGVRIGYLRGVEASHTIALVNEHASGALTLQATTITANGGFVFGGPATLNGLPVQASALADMTNWSYGGFTAASSAANQRTAWQAALDANAGSVVTSAGRGNYALAKRTSSQTDRALILGHGDVLQGLGSQYRDYSTFVLAPNESMDTFISQSGMNSANVTFTNGSSDIAWTGHGLTAGAEVQFRTTGAVPTNFANLTWYFVLAAGLTANTFRVSTTDGGAAITAGSAGSGTHTCYRSSPYHSVGLKDLVITAGGSGVAGTDLVRVSGYNHDYNNVALDNGTAGNFTNGFTSRSNHIANWLNSFINMKVGGFEGGAGFLFEGSDSAVALGYFSGNAVNLDIDTSTTAFLGMHVENANNGGGIGTGVGIAFRESKYRNGFSDAFMFNPVGLNKFVQNGTDITIAGPTNGYTAVDCRSAFVGNIHHASGVAAYNIASNVKNGTISAAAFSRGAGTYDVIFGGTGNTGWYIQASTTKALTSWVQNPPNDLEYDIRSDSDGGLSKRNKLIIGSGVHIGDTRLNIFGNDTALAVANANARFGLARNSAGIDAGTIISTPNGNTSRITAANGETTTNTGLELYHNTTSVATFLSSGISNKRPSFNFLYDAYGNGSITALGYVGIENQILGGGSLNMYLGSDGANVKIGAPITIHTGSIEVNSNFLLKTNTTFSNGAGASAGTLTNAPAVGNPTKWIPINDNGTTRYIPAW